MSRLLQTAECVSSGHPDKVADLISDRILELCLSIDPFARAGVETMVTKNKVILAGETSVTLSDDALRLVVLKALTDIGYVESQVPTFCAEKVEVINLMNHQSSEIYQGVQTGGAGDQGIMFGYSTNETQSRLPLCQELASLLMRTHDEFRVTRPEFLPDAKSQVTVSYEEGKVNPVVKDITLALSHKEDVSEAELNLYARYLVRAVLNQYDESILSSLETLNLIVNGTGKFTKCGPAVDAGLTGRKIVVDQSFAAPVGGGALSGKDFTKVDRLGAYFCRLVANSLISIGACEEATVSVAYTIGMEHPNSVSIKTVKNKTQFTDAELSRLVAKTLDFTPTGMYKLGNFMSTELSKCTNYGHYTNGEHNSTEKSNTHIKVLLTSIIL